MLRAANNGAIFISPLSQETTRIVGFAFVDDTDLVMFDMTNDKIQWEAIQGEIQKSNDRWEGGLKSTWGAIVPTKSWVYPIDFNFDNKGKAIYKTVEELECAFSVIDKNENRIGLKSLAADKGKET